MKIAGEKRGTIPSTSYITSCEFLLVHFSLVMS